LITLIKDWAAIDSKKRCIFQETDLKLRTNGIHLEVAINLKQIVITRRRFPIGLDQFDVRFRPFIISKHVASVEAIITTDVVSGSFDFDFVEVYRSSAADSTCRLLHMILVSIFWSAPFFVNLAFIIVVSSRSLICASIGYWCFDDTGVTSKALTCQNRT